MSILPTGDAEQSPGDTASSCTVKDHTSALQVRVTTVIRFLSAAYPATDTELHIAQQRSLLIEL
jgi:hypothetical protein